MAEEHQSSEDGREGAERRGSAAAPNSRVQKGGKRGGSGGGRKASAGMLENELPPDEVTTKKIRLDQARALAVTRRNRISDFALGGFIAVAPGALQTVVDWHGDPTRQWPSAGHLVEIAFAIMFGTALLLSLVRFDDPISRDVLEEIFPSAAKQMGFAWRLGKVLRRLKDDFLGR